MSAWSQKGRRPAYGHLLAAFGAVVLGACPGSLEEPERFLQSEECLDVPTLLQNADGTDEQACAQAGCHDAASAQAGLDLASPGLESRLVGVASESSLCGGQTYVDPDTPGQSLLYTKLFDSPSCGLQMPAGGEPLGSDVRACILQWIESLSSAPGDDAGPDDGSISFRDGSMAGDAGAPAGDAGADGDGPDAASTPRALRFEAESGVIAAPMAVQSDPEASGGEYIVTSTGSINDTPVEAHASYTVDIPRAGSWVVWGAVFAPDMDSDSFWVRVDGGGWTKWNNLPKTGAWTWDDVHDSDADGSRLHYDLTRGEHTFDIAYRESAAQLDELLFIDDDEFVP